MKTQIKYIKLLLLTTFLSLQIFAQDAGFSQFYGNPVYLNPALAGNKINPRLTLNYRNQWPSIPAQFVTYSVSYDQFIDYLSGGVAVLIYSDQAGSGIINNNSISAAYSYYLTVSSDILINAGFQASYQQISLNADKLIFTTDPNPVIPAPSFGSDSRGFADFSAGTMIGFLDKYYAGFAAHHLTQPSNGFINDMDSRQELKITAHAGAIFDLSTVTNDMDLNRVPSISPNILYQRQGAYQMLNAGAYVSLYPIVCGLWFRHSFTNHDAIIALLGVQYSNFKLGYSYDYGISNTSDVSGGAHEISFSWVFDKPEPKRRIRPIQCPGF